MNKEKPKRLYEVLEENIMNPKYPLHMPGHKRRFWELNFEDFDFTEIHGLDNLQSPEECIKVTLEAISKLFKSNESMILVNGSTVGILASVLGSVKEDETIIIGRNSHQSVINGVRLAKCNHRFIYPNLNKGIVTSFDLGQIEESFKDNENVKALIITSPTYEGVVMDIKKISELCKGYGVTLIVDEAHGAYFIDENLPTSAIELGADVVIQSLHKTLPAPTQTALLHFSSDCRCKESIKNYLSMLQTTSPSYFFMYTIDKLVENMENGNFNGLLKRHYKRVCDFREKAKGLSDLGLLELVDDDFRGIFDLDEYKLVFLVKGLKGVEVSNILREEYGIELEMATMNHFIAMTSIADSDDIFHAFYEALVEISLKLAEEDLKIGEFFVDYNVQRDVVKLSSLDFEGGEVVKLEEAVQRVCLKNITPYPPCVPYIVAGERFREKDVSIIKGLINSGVSVLGVMEEDEELLVVVEKLN